MIGLIRKPASFISTICDDRGHELSYAGMPISDTFKEDIGVGGVLSLLWFKRRLPNYASKFIEMVLMLTADHGPAVSGAHNSELILLNYLTFSYCYCSSWKGLDILSCIWIINGKYIQLII